MKIGIFVCGIVVLIVSIALGWLIIQLIQLLSPIVVGSFVLITILLLAIGIYLIIKALRMSPQKQSMEEVK
jgi:type III secretory pathway component EscU